MAETKIIRAQKGFQEKFVRTNVDLCIGGGVLGGGKAQPLYSKVCTPYGFRAIGDLKVGDIISSSNGGMQRVIQVHERGEMDIVEFTLSDGRTVECALDHLWKARRVMTRLKRFTMHGFDRELLWEIMTTENIIKILDSKNRNKVFIPTANAVQFTRGNRTQGLTIHPYVLGCLLGDGCISDKCTRPRLFTADVGIVDKIKSLGYDIRKNEYGDVTYTLYDDSLKQALKQKGLWGKLAYDKSIPSVYKYATIDDRKELLRGLFDTDGYAKGGTVINFDVVSKQLAEDVMWIIRSLGGYASISTKQGAYRDCNGDKIDCHTVYRVYINIGSAPELFSLDRKKCALTGEHRNGGSCDELGIVGYRMLGKTKMRCITVSNPDSLYITDNFVLTHNSFAAVLSVAEPSQDPRFRGLFLRNNLGDARASGGLLDTFREAYADGVEIVESGEPKVTFASGAKIDVTHVSDQTREKVMQRFKGRQYDFIYFDEGTGFTWECFTAIYSRNRGQAAWTGKVRMTTNPDRNHWLRTFLDWYIGVDGFIREDREGVVRYFYIAGETVKDVVWGDSKEEVYHKCKADIDRKLAKINGSIGTSTYEDMIKSFTFYQGRISENKATLGNNGGYIGSVAVTGGRLAEQLLEGNWNVSPDDNAENEITTDMARQVLLNDPQTNGDRWITADLADVGTDNFVALAWDGFHVFDKLVLAKTTPRENAEQLEMFAASHNVSNSHIIYDATRARYINDYIPEAIPFISGFHPRGLYGRMALRLKDECYMRLVQVIKRHNLSISDSVADSIYEHQLLRNSITVANEFIEEISVVSFKEVQSGKKTLLTKKEMNAKLGKGRSMDLIDPMAMRMLPVLEYPYGEELERTACYEVYMESSWSGNGKVDIHDDSFWC